MTRNEYVRQLLSQLSFLDPEAQSAALAFYDEMLDDLMEEGRSEAEAVAVMDSPEEIARRLLAETATPTPTAPTTPEPRTFTCDAAAIHTIRLEAMNASFHVRPCAGDQITLTYASTPNELYEATCANGILTLTCQQTHTRFSLRQFFFRSQRSKPIELALPASAHAALTLATSNGAIVLKGDAATPFQFPSVVLRSSNGPLQLEHFQSDGELTGRTSNGSIKAARLKAQTIALRTSNGPMEVCQLQADSIGLRTSNGTIQGTLPGCQADWAITSHTSNASNSLPTEQPGEKPLKVHTSNGSIRLSFEQ